MNTWINMRWRIIVKDIVGDIMDDHLHDFFMDKRRCDECGPFFPCAHPLQESEIPGRLKVLYAEALASLPFEEITARTQQRILEKATLLNIHACPTCIDSITNSRSIAIQLYDKDEELVIRQTLERRLTNKCPPRPPLVCPISWPRLRCHVGTCEEDEGVADDMEPNPPPSLPPPTPPPQNHDWGMEESWD